MNRNAWTRRATLSQLTSHQRIGPFSLIRPLGRGGFASVWLAQEIYEGVSVRQVALKILPRQAFLSSTVIEEVRLLCKVEHPNIVRFYSLVLDDPPGLAGLAMEYADGPSLAQRLEQGPLSPREACAIGAALAEALSAVHQAGLVHRDVKPANVIHSDRGTKLIDFGIASGPLPGADLPFDEPPSEDLQFPCGTVGYIDPECVSVGAPAVAGSDIYSLGVLLFECLTGALPARGESGLQGDILLGLAPSPPLRSVLPGCPSLLADLIDSMLNPRRAARPLAAQQIAMQLRWVAQHTGQPTQPPPGEPTFAEADRVGSDPLQQKQEQPPPSTPLFRIHDLQEGARRGVFSVMGGEEVGMVIPIPQANIVTLGRSPDCNMRFDDGNLSRLHAHVMRVGTDYIFSDAKSKNGSYINDIRISDAVTLRDGDRVRLGATLRLRFYLVDEAEERELREPYLKRKRAALKAALAVGQQEEEFQQQLGDALLRGTVSLLLLGPWPSVVPLDTLLAGRDLLRSFAPEGASLALLDRGELAQVLPGMTSEEALAHGRRLRVALQEILGDGSPGVGLGVASSTEGSDACSLIALARAHLSEG